MKSEQLPDGSVGTARYTHGHSAAVLSAHSRRGAADSAAYLLAHLSAGMDLLDVGCGPASITADLAERVAPGRVVALDAASDALQAARATLSERGLSEQVELTCGDVMALPFEDASWQDSDLRAWMNGDFHETAFTPAERALIVPADNANDPQSITGAGGGAPTTDRVFALSETESAIYLGDEASRDSLGVAAATDHAKGTGLPVDENGSCDWWLRSPGTYGFAAQFVDATGAPSVSGANVDAVYGARPALWISTAGAGGGQ